MSQVAELKKLVKSLQSAQVAEVRRFRPRLNLQADPSYFYYPGHRGNFEFSEEATEHK